MTHDSTNKTINLKVKSVEFSIEVLASLPKVHFNQTTSYCTVSIHFDSCIYGQYV